MLNSRDRRNGLIISNGSTFYAQKKSYGRLNKGTKARYNLSDIILDPNGSNRSSTVFDISNDSFKLSDDEFDGSKKDASEDEDMTDNAFGNLGDLSDIPYGMTQLISVAISDNEDSDAATFDSPKRTSTKRNSHQLFLESTPVKSSTKKSKQVLQEISPQIQSVSTNNISSEINEKRVPMSQQPPVFQRKSSSNLKNRSSLNSQSSKRWSLLSFTGEDKENLTSSKNKRFSIASGHSTSSKDKSKRFSITSTLSTTSSSSSTFRNAVNKVGNVLSSVSVSSGDGSNESTPYKNLSPGIVGESDSNNTYNLSKRQPATTSNAAAPPVVTRKLSHASIAPSKANITSSYQNSRAQEYVHSKTVSGLPPTSASAMRIPSSATTATTNAHMDTDQVSLISSNSSLKSSRSRFRLSSLFSASKKDLPIMNDNESIRSLRGRSSFTDMRKNVLSLSQSKTSLFRLTKKDSVHDLKRKPSLDKSMISLPKPDTDSANRLKNKLRNSSSILSISSVVSCQPTLATTAGHATSSITVTSLNNSMNTTTGTSTTAVTTAEFDDSQMKTLMGLTTTNKVIEFKDYVSKLANVDNQILVKFAEASYSEVFVLKNYDSGENLKIFKIIPFGEGIDQPTVDNIVQELKITRKLSGIEGFINLNESNVVQGSYPKLLMKLWDDFNELKESKNFRPEYEPSQKYLILDLEYGGVDLERFQLMTWSQALEVFWAIVKALDRSESQMKFEHRDLHWGNVVINYVKEDDAASLQDAFKDLSIVEEEEEEEAQVGSKSRLSVKLIDHTLSRLDDNGTTLFTRLDHQDFFKGRGDYQFDIYRFMRNELKSLQGVVVEDGDIDWSLSSLKNNLFWLHYILDKLLNSKGIRDMGGKKAHKKLEYLHKSLDPRRKKLNGGEASFKLSASSKSKKSVKQRPAVYLEDFESCGDVLKFGVYHGLM